MAQKNCSACDELRQDAPNFTLNGLGDTEITSLKNNTGLNPSNSNDDCTDLNNMNDCLIGNMKNEVDAYDNCHWHEFAKEYINNAWQMFKAIIAAICGLWARTKTNECAIEYLFNGDTFKVGESPSDGSYVVAGKGITFLEATGGDRTASDVYLLYIGGGLLRGGGSLNIYKNNFTEPNNTKCYNFDDDGDGSNYTYNRLGNDEWAKTGNTVNGNELLYEIRMKMSEFPTIKKLFGGTGQEANMGGFNVNISVFEEGEWAYGQHGRCDDKTGASINVGTQSNPDMSSKGHKVEKGWVYWQVRVSYIDYMINDNSNGAQRTPRYWGGIRFKKDNIPC